MNNCQHLNFKVVANVFRLSDEENGPITGFTTEIKVNCQKCDMPFQWLGPEMGVHPFKPMVSPDRLELRAPIIPMEEM